MEQNFQTSFIPKKPIVAERAAPARPVSILTVIAIFVLFAILVATGGLFVYRGILTKNIEEKENTLNLAKNRFEPSRITELQLLDRRLRASTQILSNHIAVTPIFEVLSAITMKTVRFTDFNYDLAEVDGKESVVVTMKGLAVGYRSVALQSDLFATREEGKNFIEPVFSNLTLDERGNVVFDLEFSVDPAFVDYETMLVAES